MTTSYLWTPPPVYSLPVRGSQQRLPVNRLFFVGRNYHAHAIEMGRPVDKAVERPFYFTKSPSTLTESGATVPYPPQTQNFHYEMELVLAIGKAGFCIRLGILQHFFRRFQGIEIFFDFLIQRGFHIGIHAARCAGQALDIFLGGARRAGFSGRRIRGEIAYFIITAQHRAIHNHRRIRTDHQAADQADLRIHQRRFAVYQAQLHMRVMLLGGAG